MRASLGPLLLTPLLGPLLVLTLVPGLVTPVVSGASAAVSQTVLTSAPVAPPGRRVLAISVDGLNPRAITQLGRAAAPNFYRLIDQGASTFNARSQYEQSTTLPNHTSMLTGRRIVRRKGGHGVTWNNDRKGTTVQKAAGGPVESIFTSVRRAGGSTALFAGKSKFTLFRRSWRGMDRFVMDTNVTRLVRAAREDLASAERDFTFLHLALPDTAGHADGFMSPTYVDAVARTDKALGRVLKTIDTTPGLSRELVVLLTADHGGIGASHADRTRVENYRIPFMAWGAGIEQGDLYDLNPAFRDPGTRAPGYFRSQPIRNGMVANLSASLLGLPAVPGSSQDADQALRVGVGQPAGG